MPSGTPIDDGQAEPDQHALQRGGDALRAARARSAGWESCGPLRPGSAGSPARSGGSPAPRPCVASHQSSTIDRDRPDADEPARQRRRRKAKRQERRARFGRHLLRRRRLRRVDLDLHSPVLRVVVRIGRIGRPVPADARRRELVRLERRELPDDAPPSPNWRGSATAPAPGSSAPGLPSTVAVAFDHDARGAVLSRELPDFLDDEPHVRIVDLFHFLAVHVPRDLLVRDPTSSGRNGSRRSS